MNTSPNKEKYEILNQKLIDKVSDKNVDESVKKVFLRGNPFLYNPSNSNIGVRSIEDYYVSYDKKEQTFGDVIRLGNYSCFRKKRFVKKQLKKWKKDYLTVRNNTIEQNLGAVELVGEIESLKFRKIVKFIMFIFLVLMILIAVVSTGRYLNLTSSRFMYDLSLVVIESFSNYYVKIISYISIYLLVFTLIYSILYSLVSKDFYKYYNLSKSVLSNAHYHLARNYKQKYIKVKKYYLKKLSSKKYYSPYDIKLVGEGKSNLRMFEEISNITIAKARKFKNIKLFLIIIKYILVISSIVTSSVIIAYLGYKAILDLWL